MFKNKSNRYITIGVNEKVDIRLQLLMWSMIDNLNEKWNVKVDYLQVFDLRKEGVSIVIKHCQEVPQYEKVYSLALEDIELDRKRKIYVIESGEYLTMLLPEEVMNPVKILKIIIILLQLIASGIDTDTAISDVASRYNVSAAFLRRFL